MPSIHRLARAVAPGAYFAVQYRLAARNVGRGPRPRDELFEQFLARHAGEPCLQISVKERVGRKFGDNWTSVDKYDDRDFIDRHDDIEALGFDDGSFSAVVCWSVLEHVPRPERAIAEMHRVLRPGGEAWVQLPFCFPYHGSPKDYWRVSPDGLRLWMANFDEIACGSDYWTRSRLASASYFHGRRR
jgi:SAM-dependent methyltransferase